ncbi:MAG: TadE/TadG family protein [Rhodobacteraceae bacterium]|nr:MAG: TadE/TadG family protein [Paracoccaceae bacterium]
MNKPMRDERPRAAGIRSHVKRFAGDESGVMTIFGVYIFVAMIVVVGIGVDIMRYERDRAHLQATLDRAVLAAADLDQPLPPAGVVADYFAKAGLSDALGEVTVTESIGSRTVSATANQTFVTQFMHMNGVETMQIDSGSTAQERVDAVEISLVLDVSGSMNSNSRLTNLKIAAKDFVDEMFDNSEPDTVTISIVPYATQVSAPQELFDLLNVTTEHNYSRCINWVGSDFNDTTISTTRLYERTMHFDPWNYFDGRDNDPVELVRLPVCSDQSRHEMILLEDDRLTLKNFIDGLTANGNTSLDVGMKWGSILVDPSFQPLAQDLANAGHLNSQFSNRPVPHDDSETIKVIVLMTDGENTSQFFINPGFRTGDSNIWWNEQEEIYSVYVGIDVDDEDGDGNTTEPRFYWPHNNTWQDHAYGEGTYDETTYTQECTSFRRNGSCRRYQTVATTVTVNEPGSAEIVTYADLWAYTSIAQVVRSLYEPWMNDSQAWDDWYYSVRNFVGAGTKNARTLAICNAAKANDTIVFTIGFEAPSGGTTILQQCASSAAHFFDVEGLELGDAFSSIASSIRQLRLTQ